jgi:hypothetical protein
MPEPKRAEIDHTTVEQLLQEKKYEQAIALLCERVDAAPADRTARLLLLLANVLVFGPVPFEKQIDDLRSHFDLTETDRNIVRQIFLAAFQHAERTGDENKQRIYQRLLRRQVLGQPLDVPITEASPTQFTMEAIETDSTPEPSSMSALLHPEWLCHPPPPPKRRMRRKQRHAMIGSITIVSLLLLGLYVATGRKAPLAQIQLAEPSWTAITSNPLNNLSSPQITGPRVALPANFDSAPWGKLVSSQLGNLNNAYTRWSREKKAPAGSLALRLNVEPSGAVLRVYEVVARLSDHRLIDAIIAEAKKWQLPHSSTEPADVTIPLLFVAPPAQVGKSEPGQVKTKSAARGVAALGPHTQYRLQVSPPDGESERHASLLAPFRPGDSASTKLELAATADPSILESETGRAAKLKNQPKFAAETLEQVSSGTPVVVLQKERDWLRVKIKPSGNIGYLRKEYIAALATAH